MTETFYSRTGKRWFDAICALAGLIVLSPVLLIVALAVKLSSPGPALFCQDRVGQFGKLFRIFKFRTMWAEGTVGASLLTSDGDPRITPLGGWLRKTKIDELPQLINVLLGSMSLVGPRPEVPRYVNGYSERQKRVLLAKPGVTGPCINLYEEEILARQFDKEAFYLATVLPAKIETDISYCERIRFWIDVKSIAATFPKIFYRLDSVFHSQSGTSQKASGNNLEQNANLGVPFRRSRHWEHDPAMKKSYDLYSRSNQMILDGCAFAASLIAAYLIRFEGRPTGPDFRQLLLWLPVLVSARLFVHWQRGIYRQIWRLVSFTDALEVAKSVALVSMALAGLRLLVPGQNEFSEWIRLPFSVIALEGLSSLTSTLGIRALRRSLYLNQRRSVATSDQPPKRILLYGAGRAGIVLRRELETDRAYDLVGFIDDDPHKIGSVVESTIVLGSGNDLLQLTQRYAIDEVLICMATASQDTLERVFETCRRVEVPARIIPSVRELLTGQLSGKLSLETQTGIESNKIERRQHSDAIPWKGRAGDTKQKNVLVIGGAGYIGSTLVRQLLARNYRVRVLDSLLYGDGSIRELLHRPDFELIEGDSRSVESVVRAYRDIGAVIHLGAIVGDAACALEPSRTVEINLAATKMIADICKGYGVSRFLFASTCSVYGASDGLVDEESQTNPISLYASTKLDSESVILNAASSNFHPIILRLATAFGASYRLRFDLVVNLLSIKALTEKRISLYGGEQWRPFIHVDDIARCFILSLESPLEQVSKQIFNAGSDDLTFTIAQLAGVICNCIPGVKVDCLPEGDKRNYRVSFAKVRERLGFKCDKGIEDAVVEFRQLYEASAIGDYHDSRYSNYDFLKAQSIDDAVYTQNINLPIAATLKSLSEIGVLNKT